MTWPGWSEKCALCEVLNHWGTNGSGEVSSAQKQPHLCTRILPILMPLQQARRAFSMLSPLRMMDTPHSFLAKSTPMYGCPVPVTTHFSVNGRCPRPCSTTCAPILDAVKRFNSRNHLSQACQKVCALPLEHTSRLSDHANELV